MIVWSKLVDALPVTTTNIDNEPCMDTDIQTTQGVYLLEI